MLKDLAFVGLGLLTLCVPCGAVASPSNWSYGRFPAMTSPAEICVRPGEPFEYVFTYRSKQPCSLEAKGFGGRPLPEGLAFDAETGVLKGCLKQDAAVSVVMSSTGPEKEIVQWGDVRFRAYGGRRAPATLENEVLYQIQLPGFTREGTLDAAAKHLPRLAGLGVTWVYLSPVTVSDDDTDRRYWSARQKASGCENPKNPYRPSDFWNVEPAYGGNAALKRFVESAHALGLKVMTDVVFLHCGPKAVFLKEHPEWVCRDEKGEMLCAVWSFPRLNYESASLRRYLTDSLLMWIRDYGVDGFRCDCGCDIPVDFWESARDEIDAAKKDFVLLLEGNQPRYGEKAFEAFYGFGSCHAGILEAMRERQPASVVRRQWEEEKRLGPAGIVFTRCTDTHDEANNDYEKRKERVWGARRCEAVIALTFALDGLPFLWMGQEIGWDRRYSIFGFTVPDWEHPPLPDRAALIRRLCKLKREPAFGAAGKLIWLDVANPDDELAFLRRAPDGKTYRCSFNLLTGDWSIQPEV